MAPEESSVVSKSSKSPYQLDVSQTSTACKVLLKHIADEKKRIDSKSSKQNLLAGGDDSEDDNEASDHADTPIWLIVTTKQHIVDQKRLKPNKISLPHPIHNAQTSSICLITADPQDTYAALVNQSTFPSSLRTRIIRVISLDKLKKNCKSFEACRKLLAEHELFLADDRVITYLPKILGKTFYKGTTKRPVPVSIGAARERGEDGKKSKIDPASGRKVDKDKIQGGRGAASVEQIAKEIEKALESALVHVAPGTSTSIKVGKASFTPDMVCENIQAVINGMTEKIISKGWRNIRAVHIKGPNTMAFPIWLASELWVDEEDVLEEKKGYGNKGKKAIKKQKQITGTDTAAEDIAKGTKRKASATSKPDAAKHAKKKRRPDLDEAAAEEKTLRKERLRKQKAEVLAEAL